MPAFVLVLRLIHILSGVFWGGAAMMSAAYLEPTARNTMPDSRSFMGYLAQKSGYATAVLITASLTALSGLILYWRDSQGFQLGWISTPAGLTFSLGGLAGLAAWAVGAFVIRPNSQRVSALSAQLMKSDGPPPPELLAQMQKAQARLAAGGRITAILVVIAVIAMSIAQGVVF